MLKKRMFSLLVVLALLFTFIPVVGIAESLPNNLSIASGKYHSMVTMDDGRLFVCGDNTKGQIGNGTKTQQNTLLQVMDNVHMVAAGDYTSYALTKTGDLYAWGDNSEGQCGVTGSIAYSLPKLVLKDVTFIAATSMYAYAVTSDGSLYFWGYSAYYGLWPGVGEVNYRYIQPGGQLSSNQPVKILNGVKEVYCSNTCTSIIKADGSFWCWSINLKKSAELKEEKKIDFELDQPVTYDTWAMTPVKIADTASVVAPNSDSCFYVDSAGTFCDWSSSKPAILLSSEIKGNIKDICALDSYTAFFLTNNGNMYATGANYRGLLGIGAYNTYAQGTLPVLVTGDVKKMCIGENHAIIIKQNGEVWTWGTNEYGQLGNGAGLNYNVPICIMKGNGTENTSGASKPISVIFDGKLMTFDVKPVVVNNSTLVPFRAIFEALGADVTWDGLTNTATASKGNITIKITTGSTSAYVNDALKTLDAAPTIVSGRTMVPLRFISESMKCTVDYISSDKIIDIRSETAYTLYDDNAKSKLEKYSVYIEDGKYGATYYCQGTGVLIDPSGIVLTNKHVVDGVEWIKSTINGNTYEKYKMIYEDPTLDYAIYQVEGLPVQSDVPILGSSGKLVTTGELFTFGNPRSSKDSCYRGSVYTFHNSDLLAYLFCEPGSSGSGVYNNAFELVGLIYGRNSYSITFIVPIDLMKDQIAAAIAKYGSGTQKAAA